jgi:hypothetical protein
MKMDRTGACDAASRMRPPTPSTISTCTTRKQEQEHVSPCCHVCSATAGTAPAPRCLPNPCSNVVTTHKSACCCYAEGSLHTAPASAYRVDGQAGEPVLPDGPPCSAAGLVLKVDHLQHGPAKGCEAGTVQCFTTCAKNSRLLLCGACPTHAAT